MLGAAFAAAAPGVPSWEAGFDQGNNVGGLLAAALSPAGGFGKFLLVLIALSTSCACAPTMYTFGQLLIRFNLPTFLPAWNAFLLKNNDLFTSSFMYFGREPLNSFLIFRHEFYGRRAVLCSYSSICPCHYF